MKMRHLLKPIRKNMVVISGIKTAIKIAPIVYKVGKVVWKATLKTKRGGQWMTRHPKIVKYGTVAASGGALLLDLSNIDYSAIIQKPPYRKNGKARADLLGYSRRRFSQQIYKPYNRCRRRRKGRYY